MVKSSNKNYLNRRRGISTIVGGIIFIVLLSAGFSTFFVVMDVQSDTMDTQRTISNSMIDKTQEQFTVSAATDDGTNWPTLGIQVKNDGTNPVQISNIWIINKSQAGQPVKNIEVSHSDAYIPPGYGLSIIESQLLKMKDPALTPDADLYDIKVVSTLGTIQQVELDATGSNFLLAELFTIPPDVRLNENVTIALRITNVGPSEITGIAPDQDFNPNGIEPGKDTWLSVPEFISQSPAALQPSESIIFSWQSTLTNTGTVGEKLKFTNSASGIESTTGFGVTSNSASDKMAVQDDLGGDSGEEVILKDDLFAKPGIFMTVPNTFGDDNEEGLWSVTIANPTDAPMLVTKLVVSVLFAGANDNHKIFETGCSNTDLTAIPTNYWDCPNQNQLVWYDSTSPYYTHSIPARSAFSFLVTVLPGQVTNPPGLDAVIMHTMVQTTLGNFGHANWASALSKTTEVIANVYMTDDTSAPYTNTADMKADRLGILPGSTQTFHIVLDDRNVSSQHIKAGAQLIINVPREWVVTGPILGDFPGATLTPFPDDSSQIVGILPADLSWGGKMITFDAIAPSPSCDKMYVMKVLANGHTNNDRPIGPTSDIILQVDAPPPGPVCP